MSSTAVTVIEEFKDIRTLSIQNVTGLLKSDEERLSRQSGKIN